MNKTQHAFLTYSTKAIEPKQLPSWPALSIAFLVTIAAIFPPGLLTGMNLYLLLLALIVWVTSGKPFDRSLLRVVAPFFLIIAIGLAVGFGAERYLYWKDAWYLSNPVVIICVGFVLFRCMPDLARGLKAFVIGGTLIALFHLTKFAFYPELLSLDADEIRRAVGTGYYAPVLAFTILFAYRNKWSEWLKLPRWLALSCFLICLAAILVSFSRTLFVVTTIGGLIVMGIAARREFVRIGIGIAVALILIATLRVSVDIDSNEASKSFLSKLARAPEELTIKEYTDLRSINLNWRGYETARALNYYSSGNPLEWLFGYGFGAQLDLGLLMPLKIGPHGERVPTRYAPVLHNGYAYLLIKGGVTAIALFGYSLLFLYQLGRRSAVVATTGFGVTPGRLLQVVAITLAFTTWVIAGVFNKLDLFAYLLLAGFLLAALTSDLKVNK